MASNTASAQLRSVLVGFAYNFDTERTIKIGTTDGGDDIMEATVIPAGVGYCPLPSKNVPNWDTDPDGVTVYFHGIGDTEDIFSPKFLS